MARWIDADKLKEALKQNLPQYMWGEMFVTVNIQPYIDIVRCKECNMCDEEMWCSLYDIIMESDDFCSYGERRE